MKSKVGFPVWKNVVDSNVSGSIWDMFDDHCCVPRARRYPAIEVDEGQDQYVLEAELPGLEEKDIEVKVAHRTLTISTLKKEEEKGEESVIRRGFSFERNFYIPDGVDTEHISARLEKGLLRVVLPKNEASQPRTIPIE